MTVFRLLAQIDTNPDTPSSILAATIVGATLIITGLLAALRTVYKRMLDVQTSKEVLEAQHAERLESMAKEYAAKTEAHLSQVLTIALESKNSVSRAEQTVEAAMVIIHTISGRPPMFNQEQLTDILYLLRALRDRGLGPQS